MVMGLLRLKRPDPGPLYGALVAAARRPELYLSCCVPDTVEGRLELLFLHVGLAVDRLGRLGRGGEALGRRLSERFFDDVEIVLRENGFSDKGLSKRMGSAAEAFYGRLGRYAPALARGDRAALVEALTRNVYAGQADAEGVEALALHVRRLYVALETATLDRLATAAFGEDFPLATPPSSTMVASTGTDHD